MSQPMPHEQPSPATPLSTSEHPNLAVPRPARSKNGCNACRYVRRVRSDTKVSHQASEGEKFDATNEDQDVLIANAST